MRAIIELPYAVPMPMVTNYVMQVGFSAANCEQQIMRQSELLFEPANEMPLRSRAVIVISDCHIVSCPLEASASSDRSGCRDRSSPLGAARCSSALGNSIVQSGIHW